MKLLSVTPLDHHSLEIRLSDGRFGLFDIGPYLGFEAFEALREPVEFRQVRNGGYFVEWPCGADLSIDTIEAHLEQY